MELIAENGFHGAPTAMIAARAGVGTGSIYRCESGNESLKCLFEQGIAAGVIKDLPVVVLFAIFIGSLISVTRDHILGFIILDRHLIQQTADACWDAIKKQE